MSRKKNKIAAGEVPKKNYSEEVAKAVRRYNRARSRKGHMKAHWHLAKVIQKETGQSLSISRKIASAVAHGAAFAGRGAQWNYQYIWRGLTDDDRWPEVSVVSDTPLNLAEQKRRVMELYQAQAGKEVYQEVEPPSKLVLMGWYVRGKEYGKQKEVIKSEKLTKLEVLREEILLHLKEVEAAIAAEKQSKSRGKRTKKKA